MQYFLDSADTAVIQAALAKYPLDGVTTNPAILARDISPDDKLSDTLLKIHELTKDKLLFVQVTSPNTAGMICDAHKIIEALGGKLSIKIPATPSGFTAMKILAADGINITATAVYTTSQAVLAARSGAKYIAPYISHIDNLSLDGAEIACEMAQILKLHNLDAQILGASFRTASQVERIVKGGVSAVTVTAEMLDTLASHPGTIAEIASFEDKWNARFGKDIFELL
ncbi:MAG: transaldolase [Clostridiales bacterium]|nr:transaldolase [Clostridiales bacterium]